MSLNLRLELRRNRLRRRSIHLVVEALLALRTLQLLVVLLGGLRCGISRSLRLFLDLFGLELFLLLLLLGQRLAAFAFLELIGTWGDR